MSEKINPIHDLTGRRRGWGSVLVNLDGRPEIASRLVQKARQRQWQLISLAKFFGVIPANMSPRGAIVGGIPSDPLVRELLKRGIPTVRIGEFPHPEDHLVPAIMPDRSAAGRLAAEHLSERDFKHVAFVGREPWGDNRLVYDAFAARAAELGCTCHLMQIPLQPTPQPKPGESPAIAQWRIHQKLFTEFLKTLPRPVGLLAIADRIADRYAYWATEAGLRVPEDLAVMGIGNDELVCECTPVPITSVALDNDGIAEATANLLGQLMEGSVPEQTTLMVPPLGVVKRQSTDVLAASDPLVVQALRFMWDHVNEDLSVDQIAHHVGVARRTLEKAFRRDLGRGINAEFKRRKLEKARDLLMFSHMGISEIADTLGFSGLKYFGEAFRAAYGKSPSQYRRQAHSIPLP